MNRSKQLARAFVRGGIMRLYKQPTLRAAARKVKWLVPVTVRVRLFRLANQSWPAAAGPALSPEVPYGARWILLAIEGHSVQPNEQSKATANAPSP